MANRIVVYLLGDVTGLSRAFRKGAEEATGFNRAIDHTREKTRDVFKEFAKGALAGVGFAGIVEGIKTVLEASENLERQQQRTEAVFKESGGAVVAWSKTTANALGISQQAALKAADGYGAFFEQMGIGPAKAAAMSESIVKLAADLGSASGKPADQALKALQTGLAGRTAPLRQFGVFLTKQQIQQEAVTLGFGKSIQAAARAKTAYQQAGTAFSSAQKTQTTATHELTKAQTELSSSQRAVETTAQAVTNAQQGLQSAEQGVTSAEDRQQSASESLTGAKQALTAAQKAGRDSQVALTQARKDATEQLIALKDASTDATLSEERSQLSLEQARQHLSDVMADPTSSALDRRDAILSVAEATQSLHEATEKAQAAAKQHHAADAKGVDGAANVVAARQQITKSHQAEETATVRVAQAQRTFAQAQQGVANALGKVAQAQQTLATAQANSQAAAARNAAAQTQLTTAQANATAATRNAKAAEDQLAAAKAKSDRLNKGRTKGLTDEQRALATYQLILKDTAGQQGNFAKHSDDMRNASLRAQANIQDLSASFGGKLAPSVTKAVDAIANWLGKGDNQKKLIDTLTGVINALKGAVDFLKDAFHLLNKATGSSANTLKFLIGMYAGWKTIKIASKIGEITSALGGGKGGLSRATKTATGAAEDLAGSMVGKKGVEGAAKTATTATEDLTGAMGGKGKGGNFGLYAAALLAGFELGNMAIDALNLRKPLQDLGGDVYNLVTGLGLITNPLDKFKGKILPSQQLATQLRRQAAGLERRGLTTQQAANALVRQHPGLAMSDAQVYAGVTGSRTAFQAQHPRLTVGSVPIRPGTTINIQAMHLHGVPSVRQLEDAIRKQARQRPRTRRG